MKPLIHPQQIWLSTTPMDMRSGSNKLLAFILVNGILKLTPFTLQMAK